MDKMVEAFKVETFVDLNEQKCKGLVEILELRNKLYAMELEVICFRGCDDDVEYLKKLFFC